MRILDWYVGTCGSYSHNILNSADVKQSIDRYPMPYRYRTSVVYNGVPKFVSNVGRDDARSRFGLERGDVALVSIGRLTKQKNQIFLIQLLGVLENFILLIAGDGPEYNTLQQEAESMGVGHRLRMLGGLDEETRDALLSATDIFAMPSIFEGQSNSLLEAMAAGKPVIVSDLACHRETLGEGARKAGYVVPITEPNRWISALVALGQSEAVRRDYSKRAKKRIDFFSVDRMCSGFESCLPKTRDFDRRTVVEP